MIAGQQFCGEDWSKLKKRYHAFDEEALRHYCFSSAYSVALLHDSLGISLDDERYYSFYFRIVYFSIRDKTDLMQSVILYYGHIITVMPAHSLFNWCSSPT